MTDTLPCPGCNPGYEAIRAAFGPMGRYGSSSEKDLFRLTNMAYDSSVKDLELFCRLVFGEQDGAHQNVPIPFRPVELPKRLKFGFYFSGQSSTPVTASRAGAHDSMVTDTMVQSSPANVRAVQETVDALRSHGHECVEFTPSLSILISLRALGSAHILGWIGQEAMGTFVGLATADGYRRMLSTVESDPKVLSHLSQDVIFLSKRKAFSQESSLFLSTLGPKLPGW